MPYDNTTPAQDIVVDSASTMISLKIDELIEIIEDLDTQLSDAHERIEELENDEGDEEK